MDTVMGARRQCETGTHFVLTPLPGSANFLILTVQTGEIWDFDTPKQQTSSISTHSGRYKLPLTHPGKISAGAYGHSYEINSTLTLQIDLISSIFIR